MARGDKTKRQAAPSADDQDESALAKLGLLYPVLMSCMLERNDAPDGAEDEKAKRFYHSTVRTAQLSDLPYFAVCEFSAGQKLKDTKVLELQATYLVGFSHQEGALSLSDMDKSHLLWEMAEAVAWPLFRHLFAHIASQSGEELPLLPNIPKLRWAKSQEEGNE